MADQNLIEYGIILLQFINPLSPMVGTGEERENTRRRRNRKKSVTSVGNGARHE